ncbi:hypothetical protein GGI15_002555 [Coemansia interrupta]|uniref:xanthine dehydrogenase n=1 Tax=Coemansia interrupta TaxID=1126814 RepID=A0A9W8HD23_9FUNG|nr:hypothetical protein GGI15_002555 [Coemansia interrupta]
MSATTADTTNQMQQEETSSQILFYLNGSRVVIEEPDLDQTLLQYLRTTAGLTGTKLGCGEGGCGACTVMISRYDTVEQRIVHASVNACLCPLYTVDGKHVITVEGLGTAKNPHAVQQRIALLHGSQCGFCTPGFVMSLYTLLRNNPNPTEHEVEECFDGNLCRCTGYRPILDAAKTFAEQAWKAGTTVNADGTATVRAAGAAGSGAEGCGIEGCCRLGGDKKGEANSGCCRESEAGGSGCCRESEAGGSGCCREKNGEDGCCKKTPANGADAETQSVIAQFKKYDAGSELIFPPFLIRYAKGTTALDGSEPQRRMLAIASGSSEAWCRQFFRPLTLDALLALVAAHPGAKLVAGNSEVGVEMRLKRSRFPVQIFVNDVAELQHVREAADEVVFGANITLERFGRELAALEAAHGSERTQAFAALRDNLRFFAGRQIRNVATLAGNIATASPISDLSPVLMAAGAAVELAAAGGRRRRVAMADMFTGYRRTALRADEVIVGVAVPFSRPGERMRAFKQAKRRDDDIAIVTCGLRVRVDAQGRVADAAFAFGGMAPTTVLARRAMAAATADGGAAWGDRAVLARLLDAVQAELRLDYGVPGGMAEYRAALAGSFMLKFWALTQADAAAPAAAGLHAAEMDDGLGAAHEGRAVCRGRQAYASVRERAVVGRGVAHASALQQATGEARYVDDMPPTRGELHMALVPAAHAHARILGIDASDALAMPGVVRVLTAADVPGENVWNIFADEEVLPTTHVHYAGQPVALVVAASRRAAQDAAQAVHVTYEALPAVLTVRDAVAQGALFGEERALRRGDVDAALAAAPHVLAGESYCGAQEHFYLEPMGALAVPRGEADELDVYASTQNPTETQMVCAAALGVAASRVVCRVKRLGGGFGGKESRSVLLAAFAALGAHHTRAPVRAVLDRDDDMRTSGQRHPFLARWTVGFDGAGRLLALRMHVFSNGGFSHDLSVGVLERAVSHVDNCYRLGACEIVGRIARTNTQSNTAFRGFGGCQGMFLLESMLCEVAAAVGRTPEALRRLNMYRAGDTTPFGQRLDDWNVPLMWDRLAASADFAPRRAAVDAYNARSRHRKRGLAMLPTKFGISFGVKFLNQGMALVHVYTDGSVLVAHGGTEMGQGLHTKMAQVAAETLRVPLAAVFVSETATNTAANTSPTAASASSDLNGFAVHNACAALAERLRPYRERMPDASFARVARAAYLDRVSLTAAGHYATPDIGFDWQAGTGQLYFYFTQGVAVAEVELDTLTGAHTTRRVDILMDVGRSLNKALDIGQIEGAFAQGQGWTTTEEFLYFPRGPLFTQGPGNYKIPSAMDIPRDFRVALLEGLPYEGLKTIYSSKGVGEPPLFLGASVFFALRDAVVAARKQEGVDAPLHMESPATPEILRMACVDQIVDRATIPAAEKEGKVPFAVRI